MIIINISKVYIENNRMSGYREVGGREEGREEGRGRTEEREGEGEEGRGRREGEITKWVRYIWIFDGLFYLYWGDIIGRSELYIF